MAQQRAQKQRAQERRGPNVRREKGKEGSVNKYPLLSAPYLSKGLFCTEFRSAIRLKTYQTLTTPTDGRTPMAPAEMTDALSDRLRWATWKALMTTLSETEIPGYVVACPK